MEPFEFFSNATRTILCQEPEISLFHNHRFLVYCRSWRGVTPSRPRGVAVLFVVRLAVHRPRRPHTYRARAHPRVDSAPEVASADPHPRRGIPWEDC